jgi:nucleoid-associated protein YgaU
MKKIYMFFVVTTVLFIAPINIHSQEEGLEETFVEEVEGGGAEGLVEEPASEEALPLEETSPEELASPPVEEALPAGEEAPETVTSPGVEAPTAGEVTPGEELPAEELPVEEALPAGEEAPAPAPVVEAPSALPVVESPAVSPAPAPAVVVTPPPAPATTQAPTAPSALTEEESKAAPPPITASMFPEPTPGTFMKRPNIVFTQPFEYIVKDGDDLHYLAARFYGNARLWTKIYEANRKVLGNNPNVLTRGTRLIIPPVK